MSTSCPQPFHPDPDHQGSANGAASGATGAGADVAVQLAGLANQVAALWRVVAGLGGLGGLSEKVDELAELVAQLAEHTAHTSCSGVGEVVVASSWLALPADPDAAAAVLADLCGWLGAVYLRYADAAASLPECWLWHPDLVEELLWLRHAWAGAYQEPCPSAGAAGEWHERSRPGVVERIRASAGACSLESHQPRPGRPGSHQPVTAAPVVPLAEQAAGLIATWWGSGRGEPAPQPTAEHLVAAEAARRAGGRR